MHYALFKTLNLGSTILLTKTKTLPKLKNLKFKNLILYPGFQISLCNLLTIECQKCPSHNIEKLKPLTIRPILILDSGPDPDLSQNLIDLSL